MKGSSEQAGSLNFLAGGGEMGERIRTFDWASTQLGVPEDWPQSLKTAIRIMLMSRQPVWIGWGPDLLYFYNDPYFSIIGGKHPWALGKPTREVWHEIWDVIGPMLATAMSGDEGTYVESQQLIMERNGYPEETYYTFSYSPIPNDEGQPAGIFCANSEDTQRVIGQRELALLRELGAQTSKTSTIELVSERSITALESNPWDIPFAALYLVEPEGVQATLAHATPGLSGVPLVRSRVDLGDPFYRFGQALQVGSPQILEIGEFSSQLPSGPWQHSATHAVILPLQPAGETSHGGILMCGLSPYRLINDIYIGFLKLLAGQIGAALADAEAVQQDKRRMEAMAELDRAKTAFFANVSHEFRTPLTLILGPLDSLIGGDFGALPARVKQELEMMRRNGRRLQKLVNTLLDFSRLEAGKLKANFSPTDFSGYTAELASAFSSTTNQAGLDLIIECPPFGPENLAYLDRDLWEKVVLNLVSNAFKHTFEGSIRVATQLNDSAYELSVTDTGIGISPQNIEHLFERFRRVEGARARSYEGSGIGLALVNEIVTLHGGTIKVSSETQGPQTGTTFTISIPRGSKHLPADQVRDAVLPRSSQPDALDLVQPEEIAEESLNSAAEKLLDLPIRSSGATVLVADDNADMRAYISRLLGSSFRVETVGDGKLALEFLRASKPDLLITDVMMPQMDGFALLNEIRSDPQTADLPVIMLSARAGEESRIEGLDAGADDYLVKPFSARELVARVDSTLRLAAMRQEVQESLRQSQIRLQLALDTAESDRARLRDLFLRAPALICVLNGPDHVFELANPMYLATVGRADELELIGKPIRKALPELAGQGFFEILDGVFRTGESYFGLEQLVRLDKSGEGVLEDTYMDFVYQPYRDRAGKVEGILVHAVDVTAQVLARQSAERQARDLEEKVTERTVELTRANEQLQGFTYSVAHDLRQQIRRISSNAGMILHDEADSLNEDSRTKLNRMVSGAHQLSELVDDLLSYAKLGIATVNPESVDLSAMAKEIADHLSESGQYPRRMRLEIQPTPVAFVDRSMARVILENLIENAFKYSRDIDDPFIEFGFAENAYFVRDNGVGFDMRFAHKLFLAFERLHSDPAIAGTGIGLANVKRLIDKHQGRIWAEGATGMGSTFWFRLPNASSDPVSNDANNPKR